MPRPLPITGAAAGLHIFSCYISSTKTHSLDTFKNIYLKSPSLYVLFHNLDVRIHPTDRYAPRQINLRLRPNHQCQYDRNLVPLNVFDPHYPDKDLFSEKVLLTYEY